MTPTTGTPPDTSGNLLLKVIPPRIPRQLLARTRLASFSEPLRDYPLVLVQAPAGFGKTSLMAQWRREQLARGTVVAWLSAQAQDHPIRLLHALALAMQNGASRPGLGRTLLDVSFSDALQAITTWLAELAQAAFDTMLFIDEADRLPADAVDVLVYLMRNAPPNLRVIVAARPELKLPIEDLVDYGQCGVVGPSALRFRLDETLSLIASRFRSRIDNDTAAHLHETVEGWPLGLQLALAAISSSTDPQSELAMLTRRGALHEQLVALLLSNLNPDDVNFLVRVSIADDLQPELCQAITGEDDSPDRLARLTRDTPIFSVEESGEWLHIHQLARDVLRRRFSALPSEQRIKLHDRAARWLAERGLLESAARHALSSEQRELAYDLAEQSLYRDLMAYGRHGAVLEWLERVPSEEMDRRPRLLLAAAWALANSGRHTESVQLVKRIMVQPNIDDALRCECDLILSAAAAFADDPDRYVELCNRWGNSSPLRDPILVLAHHVQRTYCDVLAGEPALARLRLQHMMEGARDARNQSARWAEFAIGLSYLREGQMVHVERQLRSTLAMAEADFGRRNHITCMVAALLAAALWEMNRVAEATLLLANRLDVLEQFGTPEIVILSYRTSARFALDDQAEHRALELLAGMEAVGIARDLPSVRIASLVEQVRLHARQFRAESCRVLTGQIDAMLNDPALNRGPLWKRDTNVQCHLAHVYAAIAAQDWRRALDRVTEGEVFALQTKEARLRLEFLGLRALALNRCGEGADDLLREAADLAQAYGLRRVFADTHPLLADLVHRIAPAIRGPLAPPRVVLEPASPRSRAAPSMALTPKEREVLVLLDRSLTNKEIGLAMQISEQAIKWHIKNLFAKLNAGSRKHVVQRARILGLLEEST